MPPGLSPVVAEFVDGDGDKRKAFTNPVSGTFWPGGATSLSGTRDRAYRTGLSRIC